jgi:hypothetical protein
MLITSCIAQTRVLTNFLTKAIEFFFQNFKRLKFSMIKNYVSCNNSSMFFFTSSFGAHYFAPCPLPLPLGAWFVRQERYIFPSLEVVNKMSFERAM